jgi:hypothetical protein
MFRLPCSASTPAHLDLPKPRPSAIGLARYDYVYPITVVPASILPQNFLALQ